MIRNVFAIAIAAAVGLPAAAYPCGNAIMLEGDRAVRLIASAEAALEAGQPRKALRKLRRHDFGDDATYRRAELVRGAALVRTGQATFAAARLRSLAKNFPKDTVVQTRLGEALTYSERRGTDKEALKLLSRLAKRDLMADARGYLALARLHDRAGHPEARDQALTRCRAMAKSPKMCTASGSGKKSRPSKSAKRPVG